jgi:hypothetical protein
MLALPVPDYFQEDTEDALRARMKWLEAEVSLGAPFFARLLRLQARLLHPDGNVGARPAAF